MANPPFKMWPLSCFSVTDSSSDGGMRGEETHSRISEGSRMDPRSLRPKAVHLSRGCKLRHSHCMTQRWRHKERMWNRNGARRKKMRGGKPCQRQEGQKYSQLNLSVERGRPVCAVSDITTESALWKRVCHLHVSVVVIYVDVSVCAWRAGMWKWHVTPSAKSHFPILQQSDLKRRCSAKVGGWQQTKTRGWDSSWLPVCHASRQTRRWRALVVIHVWTPWSSDCNAASLH